MWISKKQWSSINKKVAYLEKKVQNQPLEIINALCEIRAKQMKKANLPRHRNE